ncbi:MAG: hypothetical protein KHX56_06325 [Clostridiales bacterium]|nr:hypothetical protein [Clostridiales bacterium]
MVVRICPYCDQKMTKKHHCDCCNSFVWKANKVDIHLSQSFQESSEQNQSYGYNTAYDKVTENAGDEDSGYQNYNYPETDVKNKEHEKQKPFPGDHLVTELGKDKNHFHKSGARRAVIAVAVVIVVAACFSGIIFSVVKSSGTSFIDEALGDYEEDYPEEVELAYEDLSSYTDNCNVYDHLAIDGEELAERTEKFVLEQGYSFQGADTHFYGYKIEEPTEKNCYEWIYSLNIGDSYDEFFSISYDAITNDVHRIDISLKSAQNAAAYLEFVLKDMFGVETVEFSELEALFEGEDGQRGYCKNCEIAVYQSGYSDIYDISVRATNRPYDDLEEPAVKEYSEKKVIENGTECNESLHLDVTAAQSIAKVDTWFKDTTVMNVERQEYTENNVQIYHQLGGLEYELYSFIYQYAWVDEDMNVFFVIESDTYSDRIHGIYASGFSMDDLDNIVQLMTDVAGCEDVDGLAAMAKEQCESDGYAFVEFDGLELYVSDEGDNTCYVELYPIA